MRREGDALSLTEAGSAWRNFFEEAAASLQAVKHYARQEYEARRTTALIGVSEWLDPAVLEEALAGFDGDWELSVMSNTELLDCLESGEADAALWSEGLAPVNRGFDITVLGREELCLYVPEDGKACPLLVCPGWPRSFLENRAISTQEMVFQGFIPTGMRLTETLDELISLLKTGRYAAVGDVRFGRFRSLPGLRTLSLGKSSHVTACRRSNAGDDCAARLLKYLRAVL